VTDAVFTTSPTVSPAQSLGGNAGTAGAQAGLAVAIPPLVPPIAPTGGSVTGAANAQSVLVLAGKAVAPLSTPVIYGGVTGAQTYLSLMSSGVANGSNVP
jgi:hypothetical protein